MSIRYTPFLTFNPIRGWFPSPLPSFPELHSGLFKFDPFRVGYVVKLTTLDLESPGHCLENKINITLFSRNFNIYSYRQAFNYPEFVDSDYSKRLFLLHDFPFFLDYIQVAQLL
jgi:hypothetical protein